MCKNLCSLNDTTELRKLILENPELPLLVFCHEDTPCGEGWTYSQAYIDRVEIENLTLYKDTWMDKDSYEERLADDLENKEEYKDMSSEDYSEMIEKKVSET